METHLTSRERSHGVPKRQHLGLSIQDLPDFGTDIFRRHNSLIAPLIHPAITGTHITIVTTKRIISNTAPQSQAL